MSLLLVAHGSRDPRFATTLRGVRDAVGAATPDRRVELAYLDLTDPLVGTALDALAGAGGRVTVVPLLLGDGYHSRFDLPVLLDESRRRHPGAVIDQTPVLGSISLATALVDRLHEAGAHSGDGVLMYAVGSSDEGSDEAARRRGAEVARLTGLPVEVVFATKLGPRARELRGALARLRAAGATRIVGLPYFLSAGLLTERVEGLLRFLAPGCAVAGPLGAHPAVVDAVAAVADNRVPLSRLIVAN
ncbi:MAG: CbiX/SirB N-terminal domain-containing protein [Gordonia sp. (in: high G+C Gram-positive bacteria)]|uniref:sirohydrochlorin chelatase n=1 Tax=Gordonia sp. (in: high G+C Gram-positive bacteria) TaxID=84139 RepID=UPI0039E69D5A